MKFKPGQCAKSNGPIGKLDMVPLALRNEINRRLDDGESGMKIAAWLNGLPEVRRVLDEKWEGRLVTCHNIWQWRQKSYPKWVHERQRVDNLKALAEYSLKLGQAVGGNAADGSAAIIGGKILAELEAATDDDVHKMVRSITTLRASDLDKVKVAQNDKRIAISHEKLELDRKRMRRDHIELFLKWYADKKARDIVESRADNKEKLELVGRAIFGEDWD